MRHTGFEGDVMAWSFGAVDGVIGCPDFELEVHNLGREIPALIGHSPSAAEMVDGEFCLLHPVVTCLARKEENFNPPLLLRFPVGDMESMESGSDDGVSDGAQATYSAYLKSRYSIVKREEGSAVWVTISGEVLQMDNGVFVLEAKISHFTDYALKQTVEVAQGQVKAVEIKKLPHVSRRNVFLFVNQGSEPLMIHCWRRPTEQFWIQTVKASVGLESFGFSGELERGILERQPNQVYSKVAYPTGHGTVGQNKVTVEVRLPHTTSLEVAWATQKTCEGYQLVNVWGRYPMDHKTAMVIGPLQDTTAHAYLPGLKVPDGVVVGNEIRAKLEKR